MLLLIDSGGGTSVGDVSVDQGFIYVGIHIV